MSLDWITDNKTLIGWATALSALMFLASLIAAPIIFIRLPKDYFVKETRSRETSSNPLFKNIFFKIFRNVFGAILILVGIAMLLLPGQGALTIVAGLMLLDVPAKFVIERWLFKKKAIHRTINWLRSKAGHEPMEVPTK